MKNKIFVVISIITVATSLLFYGDSKNIVFKGQFNSDELILIQENLPLDNPSSFNIIKKKLFKNKLVGHFDIEGRGLHTYLHDIFVARIENDDYLVVIAKKNSSNIMLGLTGVIYEVRFYDDSLTEKNNLLVHFNDGYGFEGISEGEEIVFPYKDRDVIIEKLQSIDL